jgi:large subunit ribosomal protein L9
MAKVILTNEVTGLGSAGDVVEVKSGYARNYLLPQGYAVSWSRGGEAQVEQIRKARQARALATLEEAQTLKVKLEGGKIRIEAKAGTGGRLFGSIKPAAVAAAVSAAGLGEIDKRKVELPSIKSTGDYEATVRLHDELSATITLQVVSAR